MTLLRYIVGASCLLTCASLGCGGGNAPAAGTKVAKAPPAPTPPPPPPPVAPSAAAGSSARLLAPSAQARDMPNWAGQRSDEPFDVKAYLASRTAPPDNAAPLYLSALTNLSRDLGGQQAGALEDQIKLLADVEKLAAGSVPAQQIEQVLAAAAAALRQIDAAQAKPRCVFVTGLTVDTTLSHAMASRNVPRLSVLQLHQARSKRDFGLAEAAIRQGLRMSRDLRPRGPLVCQLVSIASDTQLLMGIERLSLNDPALTPDQCDRLLALLVEHQKQGLNRVDEGLKMEYLASRNAIQDVQTGRLSMQQVVEAIGAGGDRNNTPGHYPRLNFDAEVAACNRLFGMVVAEVRESPTAVQNSDQFRRELDKLAADAKAARPTTQQTGQSNVPVLVYMLVAGIEAVRDADRRGTANLAGLQMLIALRRYQLEHGSLPASLDAAAAETVLKKTPIDPYSGAALRYATVAGRPTIYSIGKDLKDDGGKSDWKHGTQPGDYLFALHPSGPM